MKSLRRVSENMSLTPNALMVLQKRYLWKDTNGNLAETPFALFERVAKTVANPEGRNRSIWASRFLEMMISRRFLPNSPTLMNAGRREGQLSACFVLPVEDSLGGIFDTLKYAAMIHQSGGGTGFSFSRLRAKGSLVRSTHGVASGPVSFMRIYDVATETVKQGGTRRGANMAILRADHPDILEFVDCKRDQKSILNFNISVGATQEFMRAVQENGEFWLRDPRTGAAVQSVRAGEVFDKIVQSAWECGDPGLVFLDRINQLNPTPSEGDMESTNPCGEQPLLPYESCNLGSLNLGEYFELGEFNWELYRHDIRSAVRFLDNVIELNHYPVPESRKITLKNRKIGLGVMGLADLLLMMELPYDSVEALLLGEKLMAFLSREARSASAELAFERGAFPGWKSSLWKKLGYPKLRNATVSTVAPTGTISIIAGASSGIEPVFAGVFYRNVLSGERLIDIHPAVAKAFGSRGIELTGLTEAGIGEILGAAWSPAQAVSVEAHVRMQSAFQRHSDSAVSKTVNLPESATSQDVARAYLLAYNLGCKGITVYRDRSRYQQVLEKPDAVEKSTVEEDGQFCPSC